MPREARVHVPVKLEAFSRESRRTEYELGQKAQVRISVVPKRGKF